MYNDVGSYSSLHVLDSIAVGGGKVDGGAACIIVFALFFFSGYLFFFSFFLLLFHAVEGSKFKLMDLL